MNESELREAMGIFGDLLARCARGEISLPDLRAFQMNPSAWRSAPASRTLVGMPAVGGGTRGQPLPEQPPVPSPRAPGSGQPRPARASPALPSTIAPVARRSPPATPPPPTVFLDQDAIRRSEAAVRKRGDGDAED